MNIWQRWAREMAWFCVTVILLVATLYALDLSADTIILYCFGVLIGGGLGIHRGIRAALKEHSQ